MPLIIGISGATNAGKTSLCEKLRKCLKQSFYMSMDDYFKEPEMLNHVEEANHGNWEEVHAVDFDRMLKDIKLWLLTHSEDESILLVEGILIFNYQPLLDFFDQKFFLTLSKQECCTRRSSRHYVPPDPPRYFDVVVWPMYLKNKEELKDQSDIVYLDGASNQSEICENIYQSVIDLVSTRITNKQT